jgi:hypothetical protein
MKNKTGTYIGKREFAVFKAECKRWIGLLGLTDWRLHYEFDECENALATVNRDYEGRTATICLSTFLENIHRQDAMETVKGSAKHEVLHLLLGELEWLNGKRCVTADIWAAAEHGVMRRLEKVLK